MSASLNKLCVLTFALCMGCSAALEEPTSELEAPKAKLEEFSIKKSQYAGQLGRTECPDVSDLAEQLVASHADKLRGQEYCLARGIDKVKTFEVVVFTLEGVCRDTVAPNGSCGNNYSQYMTGILMGRAITPIRVGQKGMVRVESVDITDGYITLSVFTYKSGDGNWATNENNRALRVYKVEGQSFTEIAP